MTLPFPIANYRLEKGSSLDRARLVKFMQRAYRDLGAIETGTHLADTVGRHINSQSNLWWLIGPQSTAQGDSQMSLQVFEDNLSALNLYQKLGYQPQARWMSLEI